MATLFKQKSITERQGIVYPERVILANLSHGNIIIDKKGIEKTFVIPEGISVKRAYASTPGVCNFISSDSNAEFVRSIRSFKGKLLKPEFNGDLDDKIKILLGTFQKSDKTDTFLGFINWLKERKTMTEKEIEEEDDETKDTAMESRRYVHTFDQFYKLSTYLPGDTIINKKFSRTNSEATRNEWVSTLINIEPGNLDLLTIMRPQTREGETFLFLSDIINYLKDNGVKEIIMFDFSCSTFTDEEHYEINDREIRARRRAITKDSSNVKFGGKKRQSRKKRKQNKHKKTKRRR